MLALDGPAEPLVGLVGLSSRSSAPTSMNPFYAPLIKPLRDLRKQYPRERPGLFGYDREKYIIHKIVLVKY